MLRQSYIYGVKLACQETGMSFYKIAHTLNLNPLAPNFGLDIEDANALAAMRNPVIAGSGELLKQVLENEKLKEEYQKPIDLTTPMNKRMIGSAEEKRTRSKK
jgi:hypothetical protein